MPKKSTEFGHELHDKRAKDMVPILRGWSRALKRYAKIQAKEYEGGDAGYHYNERTNISFLAAGAWLSGNGYAALEEFVSSKKHPGKDKSSGRIDLYLCAREGGDVEIEAKNSWVNALKTDAELRRHIKSAMNRAVTDAKADYGADAKVGCVFFVPYFSVRRHKNFKLESNAIIQNLIERFTVNKSAHLWAWCFPRENRFLKNEKSFYPGVILGFTGAKYWS